MNAIERIKEQINALVEFKSVTFRELDDEWGVVGDRLVEGLEKMKSAGVFSETEIEDVKKYAFSLKRNRFDQVRSSIWNGMRDSFEF